MSLFKTAILVQALVLVFQNVKQVTAPCPVDYLFSSFNSANWASSPQQPSSPPPNPTPLTGGDFCNRGPTKCEDSKYRSFDGSCNNLANPLFGMANYKLARLLPARYSDGIIQPRTSVVDGSPLPNARSISLSLFGELDVPDPDFTLMNMQWGQIVAGDLARIANGSFSNRYVPCCSPNQRFLERNPEICFNLDIPPEDLANVQLGNECMFFVRTLTDEGSNCNYQGGPVEQLNAVTSYLDVSIIYGNTPEVSRSLRTLQGGRLIVEERNGHTWLPKEPNATLVCNVEDDNGICYATGDIRVNSSPGVTILATMAVREHNRLAGELQRLNPQWSDEILYQEARKILIAQFQHITYYELLPILLGRENMLRNKLIYDVPVDSYVDDYNPQADATILNEFTTAAFRHFHSQCEGRLDLVSELRAVYGSLRLGDWFNKPEIIEFGDNFDALSRGMVWQGQQLTDINIDTEIKHFLFRLNKPLGSDLRAIDTHRGRDHGLATYNDMREFCGIKRATTWEDFADLIDPNSIEGLRAFYKSPEDVDLSVGAAMEHHVTGALAGPTFLCILIEQFYRLRVGDRFFFENGNPTTGFTKGQLREIRKSNAARVMCDNGNNIQAMQPSAFITVSETNPIVPCEQLPAIDLSQWIESHA